jgi:hypothetical protein
MLRHIRKGEWLCMTAVELTIQSLKEQITTNHIFQKVKFLKFEKRHFFLKFLPRCDDRKVSRIEA